MMHTIVGAGKFSHAHLRVLAEHGIGSVRLIRRRPWDVDGMRAFSDAHASCQLEFSAMADRRSSDCVHIVTPNAWHAANMLQHWDVAPKMFVEKPAVLLQTPADCLLANTIKRQQGVRLYQNDWMAYLTRHLDDGYQPREIDFSYDVANNDPDLDLITEVMAHGCILASRWIDPTDDITVHVSGSDHTSLSLTVHANGIKMHMRASKGMVSKSTWRCAVDGHVFDNHGMGGSLLSATFETMLCDSEPMTDWYRTSWLISRIGHHNRLDAWRDLMINFYEDWI